MNNKNIRFYFVTRANKLFQRFKSFLRRQNITISFKQTNILLNIPIFVCSEQITFKNKHFNDLLTVNYIFINPNERLLVKVNAVRSGFSSFHKYFLITFTKKYL